MAVMRPVIGVSCYGERAAWGAWDIDAVVLHRAYVDALEESGAAVVVLPYPADDDTDLVTYRVGLESLGDVVRRCHLVIPGHGEVGENPVERWDADRRYLDDLEERGASDDPRIQLDGMPELHEQNLARARGTTSS
jgi:glyoxylase-like metal-dependent hydrolase (beta-lactamase superfamily II)